MTRFTAVFVVAMVAFSASHAVSADWSPKLAAGYLDARQKAWFEWKTAASPNGPCVSCHTGMTYLLARPALRQALKESEPTVYERGLLDRLRSNVGAKPAGALQAVEVTMAAMFLATRDSGFGARDSKAPGMSDETRKAFDQLWALQLREGGATGAWRWYTANLDPWEHSGAAYFGASLAALALGTTAPDYRESAGVREGAAALDAYLKGPSESRPLHDRLALLWASTKLPRAMPESARAALIAETIARQGPDGGWSNAAIGPWAAHADAPASDGSNAYATAFVTFVLGRAGVPPSQPALARALEWLASRQDRKTGAWPAVSMNKRYPADSMEAMFMQDAATAYASLALLDAVR